MAKHMSRIPESRRKLKNELSVLEGGMKAIGLRAHEAVAKVILFIHDKTNALSGQRFDSFNFQKSLRIKRNGWKFLADKN